MQAPAIHQWTGASISELEYMLWWVDQSIWFYTDFWRSLYLQESEWELCSISNTICRWHIVTGNDIKFLDSMKGYLNKSFSVKDLGEATYILGIKIYRDISRCLIGLSQHTLIKFWRSSKWISQRKGSCLCYKVWSWVRLNTRPRQNI